MIIKKITPLYKKTAQLTGEKPEVVIEVLNHYFSFFREFLDNPTHSAIELDGLGVAYPRKGMLNANLLNLIRLMRKYPKNESMKIMFRVLWNFRHKVYNYYNQKKIHGSWRNDPKKYKEWKINSDKTRNK